MYGASGLVAMEEKRTAIEMMGIQEEMRRQNEMMSWRSKFQLTKDTAKTQLERFYDDGCVWSLINDEEMVRARKCRQQGNNPWMKKQRVQNATWTKTGLKNDRQTTSNTNERNLDESKYERAFVNESLPALLETKATTFLKSLICYRMSPYPVPSYVMSPALLVGCTNICMIGNTSTELITCSTTTS